MRIALDTPFLKDGIRSTNFFNGRLLSAEDLGQEQTARDAAQQRMGRALGEGVAYGLEVSLSQDNSPTTPLVTVQPGLGVNREGEAMELLQPVEVSLLQGAVEASGGATATAGTGAFGACSPPGSVYVSGTGVYLLVMAPAYGREGRAVASGLGGVQSGCDAKVLVEGVRFRLLRLDVSTADLALAQEKTLRNKVAHQCLGTTDVKSQAFVLDPFATPTETQAAAGGYGLIDKLRPNFLTPCDVPLAVMHWRDGVGLRWVDLWSARRRLARVAHPGRWSVGLGERRAAEGEATFLQFQEHLDRLRQVSPELVKATDVFKFLPAAGVLPLADVQGSVGFRVTTFFEGLTTRQPPINIEGARLQSLLRLSLAFPPLELSKKELLWLYVVQENQAAQLGATKPQPYLVFSSGYMPYLGDPRYDAAHWSFGNFALP
ncbi:hypothetical protein D7V97_17695 [Corallococcus sp. CA053C]|uniref:hypothetical protein n=1 Tax=Corallococcus sp. CA053C TaxID=2316732 RepID=UPI000EA13247|nr:hypothetical protein [Corallococcus sp. CA053C]RKH09094.1 hypothetical protein D7V97_17695 [Corallococcus sp. CA053C]